MLFENRVDKICSNIVAEVVFFAEIIITFRFIIGESYEFAYQIPPTI